MAPEPTDRDLLDRYRDSADEEAFRLLLLRHEGWVRYQCRRLLQDEDTADEACQAVFVLLSRRAADIRDGNCLAAWLQQVAHGITCNLIDARRRLRHHERQATEQALADLHAEQAGDIDEQLVTAQAFLPDCLAELKPIDREVVIRHYLRCQQYAAIAEDLGLSEGAVQRRLSRALERLRALMLQRGVVMTPALLMAIASPGRAEASTGLVEATLAAVRAGDALEGPVARMVAQARLPPPATWSGKSVATILAAFAGVALLVAIVWPRFGDRLPSTEGLRIVQAGPACLLHDADGVSRELRVGAILAPGWSLQILDGGECRLGIPDGGSIVLRAGSQVEIADGGLTLRTGALLVEAATSDLSIAMPRMRVRPQGLAWLLSVPAFDRVDVVEGTAEVLADSARHALPAGNAFASGPGCPATPQPRSPAELSPAFGGLFFRAVAQRYAGGRSMLSDGPGQVEELQRLSAEGDLVARLDLQMAGIKATARAGGLVLRPAGPGPRRLALDFSGWTPGRVHLVQMTGTFLGRASVHDRSGIAAYADSRWRDAATPDASVAPPHLDSSPTDMMFASLQVGMTPDGRAVWEKSRAFAVGGPWLPPSLFLGDGPQGWYLNMESDGELLLRAVVFAQGTAGAH
ncbi:MAG: hypothetical protein RLZZ127_486 [Planctomycetota bacterium]